MAAASHDTGCVIHDGPPCDRPPPVYTPTAADYMDKDVTTRDVSGSEDAPVDPPQYQTVISREDVNPGDPRRDDVITLPPPYQWAVSTTPEVTLDEAARLEEGITPEMLSLVSAAHREPPPNYATAIGIPDPSEVESVSVDSGDEEEVRGECALSRRVGGKSGSSRADCMYTLLLGISATLASLVVVVGAQYVVGCETEIEDYDCILTEDENGVCSGCQVVIVSSSAAFGCMLTLAMVCSVVSFGDCGKCLYLKSITLCGLVFIVLAIILAKRPSFSPSYTKHSLAQATTRVKQCTAESKDIQNDVCWAKFRTNFCSDWDAAVELVCSNMTFDDDLQHPVREQRFEEILQNCTEGFSQFIEHVRFVYVGRSWVPLLILGVSITLLSVSFQSRAINFKTLDERTYP